jgi:hypothetical protein
MLFIEFLFRSLITTKNLFWTRYHCTSKEKQWKAFLSNLIREMAQEINLRNGKCACTHMHAYTHTQRPIPWPQMTLKKYK